MDFSKLISEEHQKKRKEKDIEERNRFIDLWSKTCCFTGHRPNKLGGEYDLLHPVNLNIKNKIIPVVEQLIKGGTIRFISGGALGTDQIGFWVVKSLQKKYKNIKIIVAKPFKYQEKAWKNQRTLNWYYKMLEQADEVVNVEEVTGYEDTKTETEFGEYSSIKMQKRNEYMVDNSRYIIAVWDGSTGGTYNCLKYAKSQINEPSYREFYVLNPKKNFEIYKFRGQVE